MLAEQEAEPQRVFPIGSRSVYGNDNAIYTSKYNLFTFLPIVSHEWMLDRELTDSSPISTFCPLTSIPIISNFLLFFHL